MSSFLCRLDYDPMGWPEFIENPMPVFEAIQEQVERFGGTLQGLWSAPFEHYAFLVVDGQRVEMFEGPSNIVDEISTALRRLSPYGSLGQFSEVVALAIGPEWPTCSECGVAHRPGCSRAS